MSANQDQAPLVHQPSISSSSSLKTTNSKRPKRSSIYSPASFSSLDRPTQGPPPPGLEGVPTAPAALLKKKHHYNYHNNNNHSISSSSEFYDEPGFQPKFRNPNIRYSYKHRYRNNTNSGNNNNGNYKKNNNTHLHHYSYNKLLDAEDNDDNHLERIVADNKPPSSASTSTTVSPSNDALIPSPSASKKDDDPLNVVAGTSAHNEPQNSNSAESASTSNIQSKHHRISNPTDIGSSTDDLNDVSRQPKFRDRRRSTTNPTRVNANMKNKYFNNRNNKQTFPKHELQQTAVSELPHPELSPPSPFSISPSPSRSPDLYVSGDEQMDSVFLDSKPPSTSSSASSSHPSQHFPASATLNQKHQRPSRSQASIKSSHERDLSTTPPPPKSLAESSKDANLSGSSTATLVLEKAAATVSNTLLTDNKKRFNKPKQKQTSKTSRPGGAVIVDSSSLSRRHTTKSSAANRHSSYHPGSANSNSSSSNNSGNGSTTSSISSSSTTIHGHAHRFSMSYIETQNGAPEYPDDGTTYYPVPGPRPLDYSAPYTTWPTGAPVPPPGLTMMPPPPHMSGHQFVGGPTSGPHPPPHHHLHGQVPPPPHLAGGPGPIPPMGFPEDGGDYMYAAAAAFYGMMAPPPPPPPHQLSMNPLNHMAAPPQFPVVPVPMYFGYDEDLEDDFDGLKDFEGVAGEEDVAATTTATKTTTATTTSTVSETPESGADVTVDAAESSSNGIYAHLPPQQLANLGPMAHHPSHMFSPPPHGPPPGALMGPPPPMAHHPHHHPPPLPHHMPMFFGGLGPMHPQQQQEGGAEEAGEVDIQMPPQGFY